jgi:hypothetical protein
MKALIILSLALLSLNAFASEVGEEKKSPCQFADQTNKRTAKVVITPASEEVKKDSKALSK